MNKKYLLAYGFIVASALLFTSSLISFDGTIKYKSTIARKKVGEAIISKNEKDIRDARLLVEDVIEKEVKLNLQYDLNNLELEIEKEKIDNEYNALLDDSESSLDEEKLNKLKELVKEVKYDDLLDKYNSRISDIEEKIRIKKEEEERQRRLEEEERQRQIDAYNRLVAADNEAVYSNVPQDATVIEYLSGNVTAFTPYCSDGCHGYVASGMYVGDGNIHYYDSTYGKVYIVAGDPSYPLGTIVRLKNVDYFGGRDIYAIVLDRGGAIGKGRRAIFDLLFALEGNANNFGVRYINCEILRLGY